MLCYRLALAAAVSSVSANWLLSYANINSSLSTLLFLHSFRFIYLLCSLRGEGSTGFQAEVASDEKAGGAGFRKGRMTALYRMRGREEWKEVGRM